MADYGIVTTIQSIKGNCQLSGFKDSILCMNCSFGSSAQRFSTGAQGQANQRVSVQQSNVSVAALAGKWTVELFQALYSTQKLGDVVIAQLAQAVDKKATAEPTVIQKITLTNAHLVAISNQWEDNGDVRMVMLELEFDKILYEQGTKPADFTIRNLTTGAV